MAKGKKPETLLGGAPLPQSGWAPSESEQTKLSRLYRRFQQMDDHRNALNVETDWDKWEKQSLPGETERPADLHIEHPSTLKSAITWASIQTIISMSVDQKPAIQLIASSKEDQKKARILQAVFDYTWDKGKGDIELYHLILSATRYGTGIWEEYYRADKRKVRQVKEFNPDTQEITIEEKEITDFNDVYGRSIDIRNFWVDELATSMDDARDCCKREIISFESLQRTYPKETYPNVVYVRPGGYFLSADDERRADRVREEIGDDMVEVMWYYNRELDERVLTANGVTLQDIALPYKHKELPFARTVFFPRDREHFYGIGVAEVLEHTQATYDTILNIGIDRLKYSLNKPMLKGSGETMVFGNLEIGAGKLIEVTNPDNFKELQIEAPGREYFEMLNAVEENGKFIVGADDPTFGVKQGGTATENAIAKEASLRRMKAFIRGLEEETMVRIGRLRIANIQQFYSMPVDVEKIVGESMIARLIAWFKGRKEEVETRPVFRQLPINFKKIKDETGDDIFEEAEGEVIELTADDYKGYFDVKVKANSSLPISKELERRGWTEMIGTISGTPLAEVLAQNDMKGWKRLGIDYFNLWDKDGAEILQDEETFRDELKELALQENDKMRAKVALPPTKGATEEHTMRHFALIDSENFKDLAPEVQQILIAHAEGEMLALQRQEAQAVLEEAQMQRKAVNQQAEAAMMQGEPGEPGAASAPPAGPPPMEAVTGQPSTPPEGQPGPGVSL